MNQALALTALLTTTTTLLQAQVTLQERRTFAHVSLLRNALTKADHEELLQPLQGNPILPLARAAARANDVDPDPAYLLRASVQCFAMPEVVDPDAIVASPVLSGLAITMHMPFAIDLPGEVTFDLRLRNTDTGDVAWRGHITKDTTREDLVRFRASCTAPVADLADGNYRVEADLLLDGAAPRPTDPAITAPVLVLRGWKARAEKLLQRTRELQDALAPLHRAVLEGAVAPLLRVYTGEAMTGEPAPMRELLHAERVLANIENREPLLHGIEGIAALALPSPHPDRHDTIAVRLRMPPPAADGERPPPLVLFVPGAPSWDGAAWAPTAQPSTPPGFLADLLAARGFDAEQRFVWAVLESPGRVHDAVATLPDVLRDLGELVRFDPRRVVLVGEREGGNVVASTAAREPKLAAGLVFVASGGLSREVLARLREVPLLLIAAKGHSSRPNLTRAAKLAADKSYPVEFLDTESPWLLALRDSLQRVEAFVARVTAPAATAPRQPGGTLPVPPERRAPATDR